MLVNFQQIKLSYPEQIVLYLVAYALSGYYYTCIQSGFVSNVIQIFNAETTEY